jgi:hypothetical protein
MSYELEKNIQRIISGKLIFTYNNQEYILLTASPLIKYRSCLLFESIINDEKYNDWMREDNLERYMVSLGVWNTDMSMFLKNAPKQIEELKLSMYNNRFNSKYMNKLKNQLSMIRDRFSKIHETKSNYFAHTLEGYAESLKYEYIILNTLYSEDKPAFNLTKSTSVSHDLFSGVLREINNNVLSISQYREIARSDLWRSYWSLSNKKVFASASSEWTDEQRTLAGYSSMYDSVFEHPEKPQQNVIDDDDLLDGWMILQQRNAEKNKQQQEIVNSNSKLGKAQEVFVFTDSKEGVEQILDMNSSEARATIKERSSVINKNNALDHAKLPDVQESLNKRNKV